MKWRYNFLGACDERELFFCLRSVDSVHAEDVGVWRRRQGAPGGVRPVEFGRQQPPDEAGAQSSRLPPGTVQGEISMRRSQPCS